MPLTKKFSALYSDALVALAAASQRPATVVNVDGHYAIRVDLEYNRYVLAANSPRGLWDEPDASGSWRVRIVQSDDDGADVVLAEAERPWLIDAFDAAVGQLESDGNAIVADADFGAIHHAAE
ncbi:hypothetical protein [Rhodococcus qingshengii]|uniref:hypothetical protein n=1 Tax=Rhodococcus qingshengii TaxID=334542 RepID=UPI00301B082F